MSLTIVSSDAAWLRIMSRHSACGGVSGPSSASSVMPMMPFIGVRISWLMLARNSLFARFADSAAARARAVASSACLRAVQSRKIDRKATGRPLSSRSSEIDWSTNRVDEHLVFVRAHRLAGPVDAAEDLERLRVAVGMLQVLEAAAEDPRLFESEHPAERVVDELDVAAQVDHRAAVVDLIEDRLEPLVLPERGVGARFRRRRAHGRDDAQAVALAVDRERHVGAKLVAVAVKGGELLALGADAVAAVARVARLPQVAPIVRVMVALVSHQPLERVVVALAVPLRHQPVRSHPDRLVARPAVERRGLITPRGDHAARILFDDGVAHPPGSVCRNRRTLLE